MRVFAILMVLITLLVGAFLLYCVSGMEMTIESVATQETPAVDVLPTYEDIRSQITNGTFYGESYHEVEFLMPESFQFLTLTVRMENGGVFPMDWIRIEVKPDAADVLQLPADRTPTLAAHSRGEFSTTLLTRTGASTAREVTVHYYVLGEPKSVSFAMPGYLIVAMIKEVPNEQADRHRGRQCAPWVV